VKAALATNLSDLLRYQNMLCRYDTSALKSPDIFSVHGFPVGLVQCESNLLGIIDENPSPKYTKDPSFLLIIKYPTNTTFLFFQRLFLQIPTFSC